MTDKTPAQLAASAAAEIAIHAPHLREAIAQLTELHTKLTTPSRPNVIVKISPNDKGNPPGKLADAEIHFTEGTLAGLKLIGFGIWERRTEGGRNVTFPARQYSVNGERRAFALLRPIMDATAQDRIREMILQAYAEYEEHEAAVGNPPPRQHPPSPLESSADAAGEHSVDARMAEASRCTPCAGTGRVNRQQCPTCQGTGTRGEQPKIDF